MKNKKLLLAIGTMGAIATPVAATVACGTKNTLNIKTTDTGVAGLTWDKFFEQVDTLGTADGEITKKAVQNAGEVLYTEEQEASINYQIGQLNYQKWDLERQVSLAEQESKTVEDDKNTTDEEKDAAKKDHEDKQDELKKVEDKIKGISDIANINYNSSTFSSDYPQILLPVENIRTEQEKVFYDAKDNFISKYATKSEGQAAWPKERMSKYENAASDVAAIEHLVSVKTTAEAFKKFQFGFDNTHTVKEYIYEKISGDKNLGFLSTAKVNEKKVSDKITDISDAYGWKLADKAHIQAYVTDDDMAKKYGYDNKAAYDKDVNAATTEAAIKVITTKIANANYEVLFKSDPSIFAEKAFYFGSLSKDVQWYGTDKDDYKTLYKQAGIIKVQHALVPIKQGATVDEPFQLGNDKYKDKEKDIVKALFSYLNTGGGTFEEGITSLLTNSKLFGTADGDDDFTKDIITKVGMADGSSSQGGSLGFNTIDGYLSTMDPGFGLGVLEALKTGATLQHPDMKTDLTDKLHAAIVKLVTDQMGQDLDAAITAKEWTKVNNYISDAVDKTDATELTATFGSIFRDFFNENKDAQQVVMSIESGGDATKKLIVLSSFGFHIIKITKDPNTLDFMDKELQKMAKDGDTTSSSSYSTLLTSHFNVQRILSLLYGDAQTGTDAFSKNLNDLRTKVLAGAKVGESKLTDDEIVKLNQTLKNLEATELQTRYDKAMSDAIKTYITNANDNKLRFGLDGKTFEPTEIYKTITQEVI